MAETLQERSVKQDVLALIQRLPDGCTVEEIQRAIALYAAVERGMAEIDAGLGIPHDEVEQRVAEWLKSYGHPAP
jgi:predicted transcriptional regulator